MSIAEEEADETQYWLELLHDSHVLKEKEFEDLYKEASELTAIFTSAGKTARLNASKTSKGGK